MGKEEMLEKVRNALHIADGIHSDNTAIAAGLVDAVTRCRIAQGDLQRLLNEYKPATLAGRAAAAEMLQQLHDLDCGEELLVRVLTPDEGPDSVIYTEVKPGQLQ